ncbi:uncharacterized protein CEXT_95371, partial [Caerostris extrusa]
DNIEVENSEGLMNALNHLRALSEVEKDPAGSDDEEDDSKNSDDLRMFVSVIEKLSRRLGINQQISVVQDLASNLLDMKYTEGWQELQTEGENISGFCESGSGLSGAKTKQTDNGKEPILMSRNSTNIVSDIRKRLLYDVYVEDKPFVFPEREEEEEDQSRRRRRKREAEEKMRKRSRRCT